jgi:hypothetical protein
MMSKVASLSFSSELISVSCLSNSLRPIIIRLKLSNINEACKFLMVLTKKEAHSRFT